MAPNQFPAALDLQEDDLSKMLACQVHLGTTNLDAHMEEYVYKRRADGIHLINLQKTWEKLVLAARIIATVENPKDVCVISARPWGQRAVLKFAQYTGANAVSGRFTPGTFTNQITKQFKEPRVLIVTDPRTDHQPVVEASYVNLPTIAFASTDSPMRYVDVAIPGNNKGKQSIGLLWWLLAREVLYIRDYAKHPRTTPWDVMVDMFFYRDPDEVAQQEEAQAAQEEAGETQWSEEGAAAAAAAAAQTGAAGAEGFDASVGGVTSWD